MSTLGATVWSTCEASIEKAVPPAVPALVQHTQQTVVIGAAPSSEELSGTNADLRDDLRRAKEFALLGWVVALLAMIALIGVYFHKKGRPDAITIGRARSKIQTAERDPGFEDPDRK
jgi:hypothetical protein